MTASPSAASDGRQTEDLPRQDADLEKLPIDRAIAALGADTERGLAAAEAAQQIRRRSVAYGVGTAPPLYAQERSGDRRGPFASAKKPPPHRTELSMTLSPLRWLSPLALGCLTGCAVPLAEPLSNNEPRATQSALARGQVDLNCASLGAAVISQQITRPAAPGPMATGETQGLYKIRVMGCDRQTIYEVVCPMDSPCVAGPAVGPDRTGAAPSP